MLRKSQPAQQETWDIEFHCDKCGHPATEVDLICDNCGHFLIRFDRLTILTFIISVLASFILFRASNAIWPMYLLVALGIIHLYAAIFSRGAVVTSATFLIFAFTFIWGVWVVVDWLSHTNPTQAIFGSLWTQFQGTYRDWSFLVPLSLWVAGTIWGIFLGRSKAMPRVKLASSYFLGTGSFIFGLWGVWAILIQNNLIRDLVLQATVVAGLIVPLVLLFILLQRQPPEGTKASIFALWLLIITAYLFSTQFLTNLVQYGLGVFLPRLLGMTPLPDVKLPWLLELLKWRNPISGILTATSIFSLAASGVAQATSNFEAPKPSFYVSAKDNVSNLLARSQNDLERLVLNLVGTVLEMTRIIVIVATLGALTTINFVQNLVATFRQILIYLLRMIRYLVLPICSFSLLSALMILVLRGYQTYIGGSTSVDPLALWGAAFTVMIFVLILCGASFGFAPAVERKFIFAGTEATTLGMYIYFFITLASLGLPLIWFGFRTTGVDLFGVRPGLIYFTNLVASTLLLLVLVLTIAPGALFQDIRRSIPHFEQVIYGVQVSLVIVFALIALYLGMGFISSGLLAALK
ncbi:MAG: zinc ribbon domain-containing protein [Chloroflexi bacterium]|nr:zinc ribbon domain-containing protein [Chloroflexota bacterium]